MTKDLQLVWVPDPDQGFVRGELCRKDSKICWVRLSSGEERKFSLSDVESVGPQALDGVNDNTELMHLHAPGVLHNLGHRYTQDEIYTYTGYILTAINPYKRLKIYTDELMAQYAKKHIGKMPPHVFAVTDRAFRHMKMEKKCQSIIISGDSGAGKTETSKIVMRYLAFVGNASAPGELGQKVLESNPILEAFGNAKTVRNNNSSRFGKFIKINFDDKGSVIGASIETYLLERSRLVQQDSMERNYHVFYQLCSGASDRERELYHIGKASEFHYLNQGCTSIPDIDDAEDYRRLRSAMSQIGLSDSEQEDVVRLLAGVLHLGNVRFQANQDESGVVIENRQALTYASELLCCDEQLFEKKIRFRTMKDNAASALEDFVIPLKLTEAVEARNTLAKAIYQRLFDWLVRRINEGVKTVGEAYAYIGVLDIFGFEFFQSNGFEQLLINYANEKLQQFFNEQIFKQEHEIYRKEGIMFEKIAYEDNTDCIDLIEKKPNGILPLLDDIGKVPRNTDVQFAQSVHKVNHGHPRLRRAIKAGTDKDSFVIRHYAGEVVYSVINFLDKNRDSIHQDLLEIATLSSWDFLSEELFGATTSDANTAATPAKTPSSRNPALGKVPQTPKQSMHSRFGSVGGKFSMQLEELLLNIRQTSSHFIRCVKPNVVQRANHFDTNVVLHQLRANGMLEAVRLIKTGFPTRSSYDFLYSRIRPKLPLTIQKLPARAFVEAVLAGLQIPSKNYMLGLTKVFFRAGELGLVDSLNDADAINAEKAQEILKWFVRYRFRRAGFAIKAAIRAKKFRWRLRWTNLCRVVRAFQTALRRWRAFFSARKVQSVWRMYLCRKKFVAYRKSAIPVQAFWRGVLDRIHRGQKAAHIRRKRLQRSRERSILSLSQSSTAQTPSCTSSFAASGSQTPTTEATSLVRTSAKREVLSGSLIQEVEKRRKNMQTEVQPSESAFRLDVISRLCSLEKEYVKAAEDLRKSKTKETSGRDEVSERFKAIELTAQRLETQMTDGLKHLNEKLNQSESQEASKAKLSSLQTAVSELQVKLRQVLDAVEGEKAGHEMRLRELELQKATKGEQTVRMLEETAALLAGMESDYFGPHAKQLGEHTDLIAEIEVKIVDLNQRYLGLEACENRSQLRLSQVECELNALEDKWAKTFKQAAFVRLEDRVSKIESATKNSDHIQRVVERSLNERMNKLPAHTSPPTSAPATQPAAQDSRRMFKLEDRLGALEASVSKTVSRTAIEDCVDDRLSVKVGELVEAVKKGEAMQDDAIEELQKSVRTIDVVCKEAHRKTEYHDGKMTDFNQKLQSLEYKVAAGHPQQTTDNLRKKIQDLDFAHKIQEEELQSIQNVMKQSSLLTEEKFKQLGDKARLQEEAMKTVKKDLDLLRNTAYSTTSEIRQLRNTVESDSKSVRNKGSTGSDVKESHENLKKKVHSLQERVETEHKSVESRMSKLLGMLEAAVEKWNQEPQVSRSADQDPSQHQNQQDEELKQLRRAFETLSARIAADEVTGDTRLDSLESQAAEKDNVELKFRTMATRVQSVEETQAETNRFIGTVNQRLAKLEFDIGKLSTVLETLTVEKAVPAKAAEVPETGTSELVQLLRKQNEDFAAALQQSLEDRRVMLDKIQELSTWREEVERRHELSAASQRKSVRFGENKPPQRLSAKRKSDELKENGGIPENRPGRRSEGEYSRNSIDSTDSVLRPGAQEALADVTNTNRNSLALSYPGSSDITSPEEVGKSRRVSQIGSPTPSESCFFYSKEHMHDVIKELEDADDNKVTKDVAKILRKIAEAEEIVSRSDLPPSDGSFLVLRPLFVELARSLGGFMKAGIHGAAQPHEDSMLSLFRIQRSRTRECAHPMDLIQFLSSKDSSATRSSLRHEQLEQFKVAVTSMGPTPVDSPLSTSRAEIKQNMGLETSLKAAPTMHELYKCSSSGPSDKDHLLQGVFLAFFTLGLENILSPSLWMKHREVFDSWYDNKAPVMNSNIREAIDDGLRLIKALVDSYGPCP